MRLRSNPSDRLRFELWRRWSDIRTRRWWAEHWLIFLPWMLLAVAAVIGVGVYLTNAGFAGHVDTGLAALRSGDQERIRDWITGYGWWGAVIVYAFMSLQVLVVGVPASIILFVNGLAFGPVWGSVLNLAGRTTAGVIGFGVARWMGKGAVERLIGTISDADEFEGWPERWGGLAMFATRIIPGMPSDIFSFVGGFTNMRWRTFLWATVTGFLPQCVIYAWLGDTAIGWFWWIFVGGFGWSLIAAGVIWLMRRYA